MLKIDSPILLQTINLFMRQLFLLFKKSTTFWDNPRMYNRTYAYVLISLSRVTETAVACSSVCKSIFLCGKDDLTNIEAPPEGLRQLV